MGIAEKFKAAEAGTVIKTPEAPVAEAEGEKEKEITTYQGILADGEHTHLFFEYLGANGHSDIAKEISKDSVSAENTRKLPVLAEQFLARAKESREAAKAFDPETIKELVAVSPELQNITKIYGNSKAIGEALQRHAALLGVIDPDRFEAFKRGAKERKAMKAALADQVKQGEKICRSLGISEDEYVGLLKNGGTEGVANLVRSRIHWLVRWRSKNDVEKIQQDIESLTSGKAESMRNALQGYEQDTQELGRVLEMMIVENETVRKTFMQETSGGREKVVRKSFVEMKRAMPKQEAVNGAWAKYKKRHKVSGSDAAQFDQAKRRFSKEYASSQMGDNNKGLLASIWEEIFANTIQGSLQ